jgi:transcriptional regulator with XRE-family HTH domain
MQQPELGKRLTALRKERNLTQEELVEKSHVSVRTIQRIESGEVLPRMSTVKILLEVLGESFESFSAKPTPVTETENSNRNRLLVAALAGAVYLVCEIILGAMDIAWITGDRDWKFGLNAVYISLTIVLVISFGLFARGFIMLSTVFGNNLLKVVSWLLIIAMGGKGILNISSFSVEDFKGLWLPFAVTSLLFGALGILFALLRLQDGMGELARIAGILEIVMGCMLVTVVLFFITYVILIPATVVEILILYRGYEYLSRSEINSP